MRYELKVFWLLVSTAALSACGTSSGGGGGGAGASGSGGAAGTACATVSMNEGCFGANPAKRMQCVSGKWLEIAACTASEHCTESADPAAPGTTKHISACVANGSTPDVISASDVGASDASGDSGSSGGTDALIVDIVGGEDTTVVTPDASKDTCTPKCAAKNCGANGCGGTCGTCNGNQTCDATGNCVNQSGGTIALGGSCFGQTDPCVAGAKCAAIADLSDWTCQKERKAGQSCGPGIGECATGVTCNFTDSTLKSMKCYAPTSEGAQCSTPGYGDCAAGSSCVYTDKQGSSTICAAAVGAGGTCDVVATGLCDTGYGCVPDSSGTSYQCMADLPAGSACGAGTGGCAPGSDCVYDDTGKSSATCQTEGQVGDACGGYGEPGSCVPWANCTPDSSGTTATFHCRAFAAAGGDCGYNIGLCGPFLSCSFTDASQTAMTCLKAGGANDVCGPGVGGCLPGYGCFLAASGDTTGTCKDECATQNLYGDGNCDSCLKVDPDCL